MTTRVRRHRPRVPPRKGRQPLPQFGAGGDAVDWANIFFGMLGVTPMKKQRGGDLLKVLIDGIFPPSKKRRGGNLMKELMIASQPKTARRQLGAGTWSIIGDMLRRRMKKIEQQRGGRLRDFGLGALHKAMMGRRLTHEQASMMKELHRNPRPPDGNVAQVCSVSLHARWHDSLVKKSPNKRSRPWRSEWRKKRPKKRLRAR